MWTWFDDDTFPKIRRSLIVVCVLIVFVAKYEIALKLPPVIFEVGVEDKKISAAVALWGLWIMCVYLTIRFGVNCTASYLQYKSGLTKMTDVAAQAQAHLAAMKQVHNDISEQRIWLQDRQEDLVRACEEFKQYEHSVPHVVAQASGLIEKWISAEPEKNEKVPMVPFSDYIPLLDQIVERLGELHKRNSDLHTALKKRMGGDKREADIMSSPDLQALIKVRTAEGKSADLLSFDQLVLAVLLTVLSLVAAVYFTFQADFGPGAVEIRWDEMMFLWRDTTNCKL